MIKRNKAIYSLVYQLHIADNSLHDKEYNYLHDLALTLELSPDDVSEIVAEPLSYELVPPPPEQERMKILYYLLFAMQIDGEIHADEEAMVYKVGSRLGFHEIMLREMIDVLKNHLTTRIPDNALLNIVKKYMN